ncbi:hypothetical protein F0L74_02835 [Chitinophaga agrisoli]|uniref:DUF4239 domain-containing protein n=1 Tax=Chitinophaga agrisoli TaxID=2607653 RepID=A0A5B2W0N4_9BACT|nr:hypothetical protein [Chitinophaga agrisoli]KAA2244915.1 hypothetical protein F0L74_02835 [Chitinophaga agrisoli]
MLGFLFYLVCYPLLLFGGLRLGGALAKRMHEHGRNWAPLGVEGGLLGFYGLLISFTLVQASNQGHDRTTNIYEISDRMSLLFRKSRIYDPELQGKVKNYMSGLFKLQLEKGYKSVEEMRETIQTVNALDEVLDEYIIQTLAVHPEKRAELTELINVTEQIETSYFKLIHSYHRKSPALVLFILILFSLLMSVLLGYIRRIHKFNIHITTVTFTVISYVLINVIHDMGSPNIGFLRPNFEDIREVQEVFDNYYNR